MPRPFMDPTKRRERRITIRLGPEEARALDVLVAAYREKHGEHRGEVTAIIGGLLRRHAGGAVGGRKRKLKELRAG